MHIAIPLCSMERNEEKLLRQLLATSAVQWLGLLNVNMTMTGSNTELWWRWSSQQDMLDVQQIPSAHYWQQFCVLIMITSSTLIQRYATSSASEKMCTFNLLVLSISVVSTALVAVRKSMQTVKLLQQNPPVLNWRCRLTQVVLYSFSFLFRFGTSKERQSIQRSTPGRSLPHWLQQCRWAAHLAILCHWACRWIYQSLIHGQWVGH